MSSIGSRAIEAGRAFIALTLDDQEFTKVVRSFRNRFRDIARDLRPLGQVLTGLGTALTTPFVLGARALTTYGAQLARTADVVGVHVSRLSELSAIAELAGSDIQQLGDTVAQLGERLVQAAESDTGEAARSLQALGLSVEQILAAGDPADRLLLVAGALGDVADESLRAGLAQGLFADSSLALVSALGDPTNLQRFAQRVALTEQNAMAARELTSAQRELFIGLRLAAIELGTAIAPALTRVLDVTTEVVLLFRRFAQANPGITRTIAAMGVATFALGSAMLALPAAVSIATRSMQAFQTTVNLTTAAMTRLNVSLGALGLIGAGFLAFTEPMKALSGESGLIANFTIAIDGMAAAVFRLVAAMDFLPDRLQAFARVQEILANARILAASENTPQVQAASPNIGGGGVGALSPQLVTSGVSAAFASQQTLGFTAGGTDPQQSSADSLRQLVGINQRQLQVLESGNKIN